MEISLSKACCLVACGMWHAAVKLHAGNHNLSCLCSFSSFLVFIIIFVVRRLTHLTHNKVTQIMAAAVATPPTSPKRSRLPRWGRAWKYKRIFRQFISWKNLFLFFSPCLLPLFSRLWGLSPASATYSDLLRAISTYFYAQTARKVFLLRGFSKLLHNSLNYSSGQHVCWTIALP